MRVKKKNSGECSITEENKNVGRWSIMDKKNECREVLV
jgi:hypothetical protein